MATAETRTATPIESNGQPVHDDAAAVRRLADARQRIKQEVGRVIVGQAEIIDLLLVSLLCRGHVLLHGVPGLGKTLMARTLADTLAMEFRRVQFTPDLMPSDITGTDVIKEDPSTGQHSLEFLPGPVFTNFLLADEINRTPPKTQAALLQAMQESEVTVGRQTFPLPPPFFVVATQNPIEMEGTYPLPEAQLDRFMFSLRVAYPSVEEEVQIIKGTTGTAVAQGDGGARGRGSPAAAGVRPRRADRRQRGELRGPAGGRDPARAAAARRTCTSTSPTGPARGRRSAWCSGRRRGRSWPAGSTSISPTSRRWRPRCCGTGSC